MLEESIRLLCLILIVGGLLIMMGQHDRSETPFYYFRLEDQVPENHLLRLIDKHISFEFVREQLTAVGHSARNKALINFSDLSRSGVSAQLPDHDQRCEPGHESDQALYPAGPFPVAAPPSILHVIASSHWHLNPKLTISLPQR